MHVLSQNKGVCLESETGKDVVLRASKLGTAVKPLSLGEKVLQAVVRSYVAERGQEGACPGLPLPAGPLLQPASHARKHFGRVVDLHVKDTARKPLGDPTGVCLHIFTASNISYTDEEVPSIKQINSTSLN